MNKLIKSFVWLMLLVLIIVPIVPAYAQSGNPGKIIFGDNYTLAKDEKLNGDLVVVGGNVTLEDNSALNGNLIVVGGTISSNGNVSGDMVVFGGQIKLDDKAVVTGDVVTIGGQLDKAESAVVKGDVVKNVSPNIQTPNGTIPPVISPGNFDWVRAGFQPVIRMFWVFIWAVVIAGFAMLLSLFWQPQIQKAGDLIFAQPVMTGAIGLLAVVIGAVLFLTIIPPLAVALAWLFGMVAIGTEVGERLAKALDQTWSSVAKVGAGTFLLMLVGGGLGLIPCLGFILKFLVGLLGIGGTIMTWFGNRTTFNSVLPTYTPPTAQEQIPPTS